MPTSSGSRIVRIRALATCSSPTSCVPGARSRRGPQEQWERFDRAVAELGEALEGVALSAIARAFGELSDVARELAAEIERIDSPLAAGRRAS